MFWNEHEARILCALHPKGSNQITRSESARAGQHLENLLAPGRTLLTFPRFSLPILRRQAATICGKQKKKAPVVDNQ